MISRFGNRNHQDCLCCNTPSPETIKHLFIDSKPAQRLWRFFGHPLGIVYQNNSIRRFLQGWWMNQGTNAMQRMVIQVVPIVICWELWKERCSCRYGTQKRFYPRKMEHQICWNLKAAMDKTFPLYKTDMR